jgi:hypothetical protein
MEYQAKRQYGGALSLCERLENGMKKDIWPVPSPKFKTHNSKKRLVIANLNY